MMLPILLVLVWRLLQWPCIHSILFLLPWKHIYFPLLLTLRWRVVSKPLPGSSDVLHHFCHWAGCHWVSQLCDFCQQIFNYSLKIPGLCKIPWGNLVYLNSPLRVFIVGYLRLTPSNCHCSYAWFKSCFVNFRFLPILASKPSAFGI